MISIKITRVNKARVLRRLSDNIERKYKSFIDKVKAVIKFWQGLEEHSKDFIFAHVAVVAVLVFIWVILPNVCKWWES